MPTNTGKSLGDTLSDFLTEVTLPEAIKAIVDAIRDLASSQDSPINSFIVFQGLRDELQSLYTDTSAEIIASVNGEKGKYDGFTIVDNEGRASVDLKQLHDQYPDIYSDLVKWGAPFKTIRVVKARKNSVLGLDDTTSDSEDSK